MNNRVRERKMKWDQGFIGKRASHLIYAYNQVVYGLSDDFLIYWKQVNKVITSDKKSQSLENINFREKFKQILESKSENFHLFEDFSRIGPQFYGVFKVFSRIFMLIGSARRLKNSCGQSVTVVFLSTLIILKFGIFT